jgi:hypothetical protein
MGTNYYVAENICECCNRHDEAYHIGKSSSGWAFSFRGYRPERLVSWSAWKEFLRDRIIMNEYGERVDYDWFVDFVERYKSPGYVHENGRMNLRHNEAGKNDKYPWFNPEYDWDDDRGYSFCSREFS